MKKSFRAFCLVSIFVYLVVNAAAQGPTTVKKVAPRPTSSMSGKGIYSDYCAVCHGADGKGHGPAASALKVAPNDLTLMSKQNGGKFNEDHFMDMINGKVAVAAHGSGDMPVWGPAFRNMSNNLNVAQDRIHALMNYMEEIQAK